MVDRLSDEEMDPTQPELPGTDPQAMGADPNADDDEEVRDLGFIVDDHDDRRGTLTESWQRLDDVDTNEPLETNRSGQIPHRTSLEERGVPRERFATDYHVDNAAAEAQEEDFALTSMLESDPEAEAGGLEGSDSIADIHGDPTTIGLGGKVTGAGAGLGTSLQQDLGLEGFQIRDNPLMQPQGERHPLEGTDAALDLFDSDEPVNQAGMDTLADIAARDTDGQGESQ